MVTDFGRVITAMVTPFKESGEVDYIQAQKLALALLASGSNSILVSGTTGEAPTLTKEEKLRLFTEIKSAVGDHSLIIAGTGNYCTAESVELTKEAEKTGVDGFLFTVPYYNKPTQEGLYQHFKTVAASTRLPCILYNVPSRTVTNMTADTVIRLSQIENIIAIKEASANLEQIAQIISNVPDGFLIYSGNDNDTLPILSIGGYGIISVASHLVGNQISDMIQKYLVGNMCEAARIHRYLLPLVNALFIISNPSPVKYALNCVGFTVGKPRLPLVEPDKKSMSLIETTLHKYSIDLPVKRI